MLQKITGKIFGTKNDRELKKYKSRVRKINDLEPHYEKMNDDELKEAFNDLKQSVQNGEKTLDDVLVDSFAITREASKRVLKLRHFDVQLTGGMVLHEGRIAEMKTGEGKTLVATLAVALNAMMGRGVHVVTVNDYLAQRDGKDMGQLYSFLGYETGVILEGQHDPAIKRQQYYADITYGTNNEFGFDYLRDNMSYTRDQMVQRDYYFVIVDEVDSILIDEAAKKLEIEKDFKVDEKDKIVLMTEEGTVRAQELFGVDNLYSIENARLSHHLDQALKANYLFTFQNYFRMYEKLAGMTGTAQTEATEFSQIYSLDVISIPTNVPVIRKDLNDLIYKTEAEKFQAVIDKIKELQKTGQPVLIGTASIEKSEALHNLLKKEKIAHTVLNAKNHEQEGEIIKHAGEKGAITIATNMAGRGVDIKVNDEIKSLGGLYIVGTERHENRRIDNQLRGRSGRQGDPGITQFYLSLEDSLLRIFGSDKIKSIMERLGVEDGEYIESRMVTRAVEKAQKKVEDLHFEGRKHIVEYDDVANEQRKIVYKFRNQLLDPEYDIDSKVDEIRVEYVDHVLLACDMFEGVAREDFDLERLVLKLKEETNVNLELSELEGMEFEELRETIINRLKDEYEEKMSVLNEQMRKDIQSEIYLKTLDTAWRDHLYQMDTMKTGIRLRQNAPDHSVQANQS